ncbi:MAG: hypothetical protein NT166_19720 [Candidatus Aminicenantes bacterium]|nr:hypothetical protein [Candidatus Aminicenantes bacterium]
MTHLNITLPDEIAKRLVLIPNKNRFIAKALKEQFEQERQKKFEHLLIDGYKASKLEDKSVNTEWEQASLENSKFFYRLEKMVFPKIQKQNAIK